MWSTKVRLDRLPQWAREELKKAASPPVDRDPNARVKAIDRLVDHLRTLYPHLFIPDEHDHDNQ